MSELKQLEQAEKAALSFLSYGMRTEQQVRRRLIEKEFAAEIIDAVIEKLTGLHYLDDLEYAILYLEYAEQKRHGIRRIMEELKKRGISTLTAEDARYEYERRKKENGFEIESEAERAEKEACRLAAGREIDDKLIAKIGRRLKTLGYESDSIYHAVGRIMSMRNGVKKEL